MTADQQQTEPRCRCGHTTEHHDLDDGCGACALAMIGPCRDFHHATTDQRHAAVAVPGNCGDCAEFTRLRETDTGMARCGACHPLAQEAS